MTEQELQEIEELADGEDHPGDLWFVETILALTAENRKLQRIIAARTGHEAGCECYNCRPSHLNY